MPAQHSRRHTSSHDASSTSRTRRRRRRPVWPRRNFEADTVVEFDFARTYHQKTDIKPRGKWYSMGDAWHRWGEVSMGDYLHRLNLKPGVLCSLPPGGTGRASNGSTSGCVLVLATRKDVTRFNQIYGRRVRSRDHTQRYHMVDWASVANDYAGIEFRNYERIVTRLRHDNKRRMQAAGATEWVDLYKIAWYYSVDASSGCVWNLRVVRNIEYVRRVKARGGGGMVRYLVET